MKVVILSYQTPTLMPGGAQQVAYDEFIALLRCGFDVVLISSIEKAQANNINGYKPGKVVPINSNNREFIFLPVGYQYDNIDVDNAESNKSLVEFIADFRPDVCHFHHYHRFGLSIIENIIDNCRNTYFCLTFHEMLAICMANGQLRRRHDLSICNDFSGRSCQTCYPSLEEDFFLQRRQSFLAKTASIQKFVFPSSYLMNVYVDWGLPQSKCLVVENGEPRAISKYFSKSHSPKVNRYAYFGQLIHSKGIHLIIESISKMSQDDEIFFEINASIPDILSQGYAKSIEEMCASLNAMRPLGNIHIRGKYRRDEISQRMENIDWVIVPSLWPETFALVVSEAWAHGRPVIVSDIGALSDRVRHEEDGLKFSVGSQEALLETINKTIGNEELWNYLNSQICAQFSDFDMIKKLLSIWNYN